MTMPFLFAGSVFADDHNTVTAPTDGMINDVQDNLNGDKPAEHETDVNKDMKENTDTTMNEESENNKEGQSMD